MCKTQLQCKKVILDAPGANRSTLTPIFRFNFQLSYKYIYTKLHLTKTFKTLIAEFKVFRDSLTQKMSLKMQVIHVLRIYQYSTTSEPPTKVKCTYPAGSF